MRSEDGVTAQARAAPAECMLELQHMQQAMMVAAAAWFTHDLAPNSATCTP